MHRQLTQYHTLVDISRRDGLESILVVLFEESLFDLEGHLHRFERIFELLVDFVDAAEVVKAQHPQLQHFLWWMHQSPHRLEHEYVNALRNEVKFVTELHAGIVHDSDVEFLHKRSQLVEDIEPRGKLLFAFCGHRCEIDQPLLHKVS